MTGRRHPVARPGFVFAVALALRLATAAVFSLCPAPSIKQVRAPGQLVLESQVLVYWLLVGGGGWRTVHDLAQAARVLLAAHVISRSFSRWISIAYECHRFPMDPILAVIAASVGMACMSAQRAPSALVVGYRINLEETVHVG